MYRHQSCKTRYLPVLFIVMFVTLLPLSALTGCGSQASTSANSGQPSGSIAGAPTPTPTPTFTPTPTPTPSPTPRPTSTPTAVPSLQGPIDFVLNQTLSFSSASGTGSNNGASFPLSDDKVKQGVVDNMKRKLFVVDSNTRVFVYTGNSSKPVAASISRNADGRTHISYNESTSSSSSSFDGVLLGRQIQVNYFAQSFGAAVVDNQRFSGGTTVSAAFTTQVTWVSPGSVAGPPSNGHYQFTSNGGVLLSWAPGQNAVKYNIYRFVLLDPEGMKFLTSTTSTSYIDDSQVAQQNARTIAGIAYYIYAVGSEGIENPTYIVISVSSLG